METPPLFSVILANYNGRNFLRECLESVLAQNYERFEFIVVDDGSSDGSYEIIRDFAEREPRRMRGIRQSANRGQGAAFNRGVALAEGELVAFIDSDDVWFPNKLSLVAAEFGDRSRVVFHQHNLALLRGTTLTAETFRASLSIGDVFGEAMNTKRLPAFVPTSGLTFTRRVLQQIGEIPAAFRTCADGYLTRTAMCFGRVTASDVCAGAYRVHSANQTFNNPAFDSQTYLRELLLPHLNAFYQRSQVALAFPIPPASISPLMQSPFRLMRLRPEERVLVVRSAPVDRVARVLAALFATNAEIQIDLLVQPGFAEALTDPRIRPLALAAGPMKASSITNEVREHIARQDYAYVIVPYNDPDNRNYGNVHEMIRGLPVTCPLMGVGSFGAVFAIEDPAAGNCAETDQSLFAPLPDWAQLRDCHAGRRAVIVGAGASLPPGTAGRLCDDITFAADDIDRVFAATEWRPTYYTVVDPKIAAAGAERTRRMRGLLLLPSSLRALNCAGPRTLWYDERADNQRLASSIPADQIASEFAFSTDVREGVQSGPGVLYQQLQLAFHMGIREVHWIGREEESTLAAQRAVFERVGGRLTTSPGLDATPSRNLATFGAAPTNGPKDTVSAKAEDTIL